MSRALKSVALLLLAACHVQGQHPQQPNFVVELQDTDGVKPESALEVFARLGVDAKQATPLLEKVASKGKAVVIAGPEEACKDAAEKFKTIGMGVTARAMTATDQPSEYGDSDVIVADAAGLEELMQDTSGGTLVTFYAPWCGHCVKMVPEFKKAASMLKRAGIRCAAVNTDNSPGLAQSLGIRGFPTVRWVYNGQWSEYKGPRESMDLVQFATQQNVIAKAKQFVGGAVKGAKLAMSKVLNRVPHEQAKAAGAVQQAQAP